MSETKKVLFCRSGGGLPGLQAHAGMWLALQWAGITATHCCGTSAGAIVSAFDATGSHPTDLLAVLLDPATQRVRRERTGWKLRIPWIDWFMDSAPIRELLIKHIMGDWWSGKPLRVFATEVASGLGVEFSENGPATLVDAVLASMSISGVFPHVQIGDQAYCDGGTFNNPALPDNWRDYDEVWLLIATGRDDTKDEGHGILTRLIRNAFLFGRGQIMDAMLETGLLGPYARLSATQRQQEQDKVLAQSWARQNYWHGERCTQVNLLWPAFDDFGSLRFVPGLEDRVQAETSRILREMAEG